ncbi:uncharacterized protein LOC119786143 [Cyprinodon tularosa]|uniref:uncharacterized protein LOC119786143 n=1 Tax=Cyprinodon tularosa TaxID=77115 RepID=UPI0018E1E36B|nr:uncharacterized protein LOC119786143 [Cyprinodon tularosa]
MKFKVMGPGADELQLYMGNADPVPLSRMHETCGILVKRTPFGLILLVPYDGCGVKQNGTHVLTMQWRKSVVNITCNMLPNTDLSTTTEPVDDSLKTTGFHRALHRMKRGFRWHPIYDPCYQRRRFPFFHYFFSTPTPTTTTTAAPTHPSLLYQRFFKKLLEYYPFYAHYFKRPRYHLPPYYQAYNPPEWHTYFQTTPKPKLFAHPFQKILAEYFTTPKTTPTTPTEPTVTSSTDCPQPRIGPSAKHSIYNFVPRAYVGNSKIQQNEQNYISGYSQANPDAFWESFPLLYHSTSLVDPDLEDLTSK